MSNETEPLEHGKAVSAFTAPEDEALAVRNRARLAAQTTSPKEVGDTSPDPLTPVSLPELLGMGPSGPHYASIPYEDEKGLPQKKRLQIAPFTLKTTALAGRALALLPWQMQLAALAYSRVGDGEELDPEKAIEVMRLAVDPDKTDAIDAAFVASTLSAACVVDDEETVANLLEILHLSLSRYCTNLSVEFLEENLDVPFALKLLGRILRVNSGLSERFFDSSAGSAEGATPDL